MVREKKIEKLNNFCFRLLVLEACFQHRSGSRALDDNQSGFGYFCYLLEMDWVGLWLVVCHLADSCACSLRFHLEYKLVQGLQNCRKRRSYLRQPNMEIRSLDYWTFSSPWFGRNDGSYGVCFHRNSEWNSRGQLSNIVLVHNFDIDWLLACLAHITVAL